MTWQDVIREAAYRCFCRTGKVPDFRLARGDMRALCTEIMGHPIDATEWHGPGFVRVQARVYVPALSLTVLVDDWGYWLDSSRH